MNRGHKIVQVKWVVVGFRAETEPLPSLMNLKVPLLRGSFLNLSFNCSHQGQVCWTRNRVQGEGFPAQEHTTVPFQVRPHPGDSLVIQPLVYATVPPRQDWLRLCATSSRSNKTPNLRWIRSRMPRDLTPTVSRPRLRCVRATANHLTCNVRLISLSLSWQLALAPTRPLPKVTQKGRNNGLNQASASPRQPHRALGAPPW